MLHVFDLPGLTALLADIRSRAIAVDEVETPSASPFARSLVFAYVAAYIYEGDAPLAERKAQALTLDRNLLSELLGQAELRELIERGLGYSYEGLERTVDSHIKNLRRKIEPDSGEPRYVLTVYGVGYKMADG